MNKLLILSGGIEAIEAIKIAKKMGLFVVICDENEEAPARVFADDFIHASIYHPDQVIDMLSKYPNRALIDAVITVAADNPMSVSVAAEYLGVKGISKKTAELSTNKLKMKDVLKENNILVPWYRGINSVKQLTNVIENRCVLSVCSISKVRKVHRLVIKI